MIWNNISTYDQSSVSDTQENYDHMEKSSHNISVFDQYTVQYNQQLVVPVEDFGENINMSSATSFNYSRIFSCEGFQWKYFNSQ